MVSFCLNKNPELREDIFLVYVQYVLECIFHFYIQIFLCCAYQHQQPPSFEILHATTAENPQISTELQNYHAADLDRAKVQSQ